ncbi:hypothetical protein ACE1TI_21375 [Alteribacillus sp. JSM 102045]|uniref:hypothetical protein n=1 Tax=Alteribacillus sp. JSM 102045 TaxID=1562101 RepID=UPI0035C1D060
MKKVWNLFLLSSLFLAFAIRADAESSFWVDSNNKNASDESRAEEDWESILQEAQETAEEAEEDTRSEKEKLEDFDERWSTIGSSEETASEQKSFSYQWHSFGFHFGSLNKLWSLFSSSEGKNNSENITPTDKPSVNTKNSSRPEIEHKQSDSFEEKWNKFGEKFEQSYDTQNDDWEESFDSRSGTYKITEQK